MNTRFALLLISFIACTSMYAREDNIIVKKEKGCITFIVDKDLPAPEPRIKNYLANGKQIAYHIASDYKLTKPNEGLIASSFAEDSMCYAPSDALFHVIIDCFAHHRPLVLSPDMVWLVIAQGFSHHINQNAEKFRSSIVDHEGKIDLVVKSEQELLSGNADWAGIFNDFQDQIAEHTRGNIAKTLSANFSTTGTAELIASQVTLMDVTAQYFDYVTHSVSCGIPCITLQGTPSDWQKVLNKTMAIKAYDLSWWTDELKPILKQFVQAAKGNPDPKFWKDMVLKDRPDRLRGGGCDIGQPTLLDGWFTSLFPWDEFGNRNPEEIYNGRKMMSETVRVPFRHVQISPDGQSRETPMELYAGFIGIKEDTITYALTPQIGWMVRIAESSEDLTASLAEKSMLCNSRYGEGLELRVDKVPESLKGCKMLESLSLYFIGHVEIPQWMDDIDIKYFHIRHGKIAPQEAKALKKRFPQIHFSTSVYKEE